MERHLRPVASSQSSAQSPMVATSVCSASLKPRMQAFLGVVQIPEKNIYSVKGPIIKAKREKEIILESLSE